MTNAPRRMCFVNCGLPADQCACYRNRFMTAAPLQVGDPPYDRGPIIGIPKDDIDALYALIKALEAERRNIVSHSTMGHTTGEGMSLNDVSVEISRQRAALTEDYRKRAEAAEARLAKAVEALEAFRNFDGLPTAAKRPDIFARDVQRPILLALAEIEGDE